MKDLFISLFFWFLDYFLNELIQLKFVLVDPKKVELSLYRVIEKHFLAKLPGEEDAIITDTKKVINNLSFTN